MTTRIQTSLCRPAMVAIVILLVGCSSDASSTSVSTTIEVTGGAVNETSVPEPGGPGPEITLSQGEVADAGYWYAVELSGFEPGTTITVTCNDSVDSAFWTQEFTVDAEGEAVDATLCFSADGPDHWVNAGEVESNRVQW